MRKVFKIDSREIEAGVQLMLDYARFDMDYMRVVPISTGLAVTLSALGFYQSDALDNKLYKPCTADINCFAKYVSLWVKNACIFEVFPSCKRVVQLSAAIL